MAKKDTTCCSEVHSSLSNADTESKTSRFLLRLFESQPNQPEDATKEIDADGDFLVPRKKQHGFNLAITIFHKNSSPLSLAGLQVWSGSLVMCDYLLTHPCAIKGHTVLELGSGTGLTAILAAHLSPVVFATDNSAAVLTQCRKNVEHNITHTISSSCVGEVHVGALDWKGGFTPDLERERSLDEFVYNPQQLELLSSSDVIVACDTIYDLEGVQDFLLCIERLVCETLPAEDIVLYLSMERRVNFSLLTLSAGCQPHDALFEGIKQLTR